MEREQVTVKELMRRARNSFWPREKMQVEKRQTRFTYGDGPLVYLGQQIVKAMEDAGYPAKQTVRDQYFERISITHPNPEVRLTEDYQEALSAAVRVVSEKFAVQMTWGAKQGMVQLLDAQQARNEHSRRLVLHDEEWRRPNAAELRDRMRQVLPSVEKHGDLSKNFSLAEFKCKCGKCKQVPPPKRLVDLLQEMRDHFGRSVEIVSGHRCHRHNQRVGGAKASKHLEAEAADHKVQGVKPSVVQEYWLKRLPGAGGVGRYRSFTHVDVRLKPARWDNR